MYEHLGGLFGGPPNRYHNALYSKWAPGGWGMIITGNFQVSPYHLSLGRDIIIPSISPENLAPFKVLVSSMRGCQGFEGKGDGKNGSLCIVQLSHTGRQSPRIIGGRLGTTRRPAAPSSRRLGEDTAEGFIAKFAYALGFQIPHALEEEEVKDVIEEFLRGAKFVHEAGFDGVQLHAAHGYLISQFLSPKLNNRNDSYGDRLLLLQQIIIRIRQELPSNFIIGVKLNAGDYTAGDMTEDEAMGHIRRLCGLSLDFIEISGGNYENPLFSRLSPREAFFAPFSRKVIQEISTITQKPLILLTGGLRTPLQLSGAILNNHADLLGIGRLSILCPDLPRQLSPASFDTLEAYRHITFPDSNLHAPRWIPKLAGAGVGVAWYTVGLRSLAEGKPLDMRMGTLGSVFWMWAWIGPNRSRMFVQLMMASIIPLIVLVVMWLYRQF
ncbi:hypothetical protein M422DRAFT_260818 [Sphaerobolus stellatus SS14]|uniref:NADH:flavin oxidoreductase/NADH oxidase N-terminal domain-containing protein n=1 Tax=Sphaerobolus stellatus (strain SS14) TaxID=990650 RepID=A0A0C9VGJ2_SPHS4|nr:hypothetical protein M422DRAFT_260818 [Sphaerobolus stellatus SS14]